MSFRLYLGHRVYQVWSCITLEVHWHWSACLSGVRQPLSGTVTAWLPVARRSFLPWFPTGTTRPNVKLMHSSSTEKVSTDDKIAKTNTFFLHINSQNHTPVVRETWENIKHAVIVHYKKVWIKIIPEQEICRHKLVFPVQICTLGIWTEHHEKGSTMHQIWWHG